MNETRLAIRRLWYRPAATLASVVTLACSVGAAAATWSLIAATLLAPLPVADADRLVVAGTRARTGPFAGRLYEGFIYPEYAKLRASGAFEDVAAEWGQAPVLPTAAGGPPVDTKIGFATANYFDLLGIRVRLGRGFQPAEDRRGAAAVAVLTDAYCRREFDGCVDPLGRTVTIAGTKVPVVGVLQAGFRGTDLSQSIAVFLPFHTIGGVAPPYMNYFADPDAGTSPTAGLKIIGRLRPGERPDRLRDVELTPIQGAAIPSASRTGMTEFARLLATTVALLLLLGCVTVGMLLLVRTEARRDEFALCSALGASRLRLAAGVFIEGALLSGAGALLALPVAWWLFSAGATFGLPGGITIGKLGLSLDLRVVAASAAAALAGCALIALVAGAPGVAGNAAEALRSRAGATPRIRRRATRSLLVAGQVAISLVLVAGAGLFVRSLSAALRLNDRLDMSRLVSSSLYLDRNASDPPRAAAFFDAVRARLNGNPFVASMAYAVERGGMMGRLTVDGESRQFPTQVRFMAVDPGYFRTLGVRVTGGRDFAETDRRGAPLVAIVSESFARKLGGAPLGRRIVMPFRMPGRDADVLLVVGVVDDIVSRVSELEPLQMYFPIAQVDGDVGRDLVFRASGDVDAARRAVLAAIKETDPAVIAPALPTLADRIGAQMSVQTFGAAILGSLGALAVLLTTLGSYVLAESMAVMRRREMGIRAALGATRAQLSAIVFGEAARLVGGGLVAGLALAWAGAATIRSFLFQVHPLDPATLAVAAASILAVATIVSLRPAVRAGRADPSELLREL